MDVPSFNPVLNSAKQVSSFVRDDAQDAGILGVGREENLAIQVDGAACDPPERATDVVVQVIDRQVIQARMNLQPAR